MKILCFFLFGFFLCLPAASLADERPNIVFIISDDQDNAHFGFLDNDVVHTSNLDKLASHGTVFHNCYLTASRCRPSLASLLSGRHPHQHGIYANHVGNSRLAATDSLPDLLKNAGYATYGGGKYWEGDPRAMGFMHGFDGAKRRSAWARAFVREDEQSELFSFIDEHAGKNPMFIWWAPLIPHTPHNPPQRFLDLFDPEAIPVPEYIRPEDREEFIEKEYLSLAMEAWMDDEIGRLRDKLIASGEDENTLYVFLIDNGYANGLPAKGSVFEKGVRTPVFFTWPRRIPAGEQREDLISSLDVYPTLLSYAGVEVPSHAEGIDLQPHLEEQIAVDREKMAGAVYPTIGNLSPEEDVYALYLRSGNWKYVLYTRAVEGPVAGRPWKLHHILAEPPLREQGDENLYDLNSDPLEFNDLSNDPEYRELIDGFRKEVLDWWQDTGGAPIPGIVAP